VALAIDKRSAPFEHLLELVDSNYILQMRAKVADPEFQDPEKTLLSESAAQGCQNSHSPRFRPPTLE
jgi:hypothetical protein